MAESTDLNVVCEIQGPESRISLSGRITSDSSPELKCLLVQRLQFPDCNSLTLDLYEVTYIDTSGLAVLVETLKVARRLRKAFHLSRLQERPRFLLQATKLLHLFDDENLQPHQQPHSPPERAA